MKIGVLAAQGAFAEHIAALRQLNAEAAPIRLPHQLAGLDGLIIPGGESTTISKLLSDYSLTDEIKDLASSGMPIFGTCAGLILMAKEISDADAKPLQLMDIEVRRNAFGRQKESFETELFIPAIGDKPFHAVFIRAPLIEAVNGNVEILAKLDNGNIVAVRQDNLLATSFHPELTEDRRFHQYFIDIITVNR